MKVLFVCTDNICRSPMDELMFLPFFHDDSTVTDTTGVQGLIDTSRPIKRMTHTSRRHRLLHRKRLTPQLAMCSNIILCFSPNTNRTKSRT